MSQMSGLPCLTHCSKLSILIFTLHTYIHCYFYSYSNYYSLLHTTLLAQPQYCNTLHFTAHIVAQCDK